SNPRPVHKKVENCRTFIRLTYSMRVLIRVPLRHPLHPGWKATPARMAEKCCEVLSGTFPELIKSAQAGARAQSAVFVLHYPDRPFLSASERDTLWQLFQVPALALLLDRKGRLTAWECEAHDGMHVGAAFTERALWVCRMLASGWSLDASAC